MDSLSIPTTDFTPRLPDGTPVTSHPMWEEQVLLEREMRMIGEDTAELSKAKAIARNGAADLRPLQDLTKSWLAQCAKAISEWKRRVEKNRGPIPVAYHYLTSGDSCEFLSRSIEGKSPVKLDAYTSALIAIRSLVSHMASGRSRVTSVCVEIGSRIENEAKVRLWEKLDKEGYSSFQRKLKRDKATTEHKGRSNIHMVNRWLENGSQPVEWEAWPLEDRLRVGITLVDIISRETGAFSFQDDPFFVPKQGVARGPAKVIVPQPHMADWLARALSVDRLARPAFAPCVVPPKRWRSARGGGYWTPHVNSPTLIRFKASMETQQGSALDEYDALDMPKVFEALDKLQETAWRVNGRVLNVVQALVARDSSLAGLAPSPASVELPPEPPEGASKEDIRKYRQKVAEIYRKAISMTTLHSQMQRTIRVAERYRNYEAIYFPHVLDFRGRMYPVPVGLQPQGDDLARGLLEFSEGVPITEENGGAGWLAVALASSWGHDKWNFDERISWVQENEAMFRRIAADPLSNMEWADKSVDKPWMSLAACFEWVRFLDEGFGFVSTLPVSVDGTCNGIQHLAALTRDEVTGAMVNLTPTSKPADIYAIVASDLQEDLERIEKAGGLTGADATYWLDLCVRSIPRSLTKRPVMVLPYGGTREAFFKYVMEWLNEKHPLHTGNMTPEMRSMAHKDRAVKVSSLVAVLWDIVKRRVRGGVKVMEWLRKNAKVAAVGNQPIFWKVPSGFTVRHFYGKVAMRNVRLSLNGTKVLLSVGSTTKDLSVADQMTGVAPNFIHSLDASCLVDTIIKAGALGVTSFMAIHDAYGTHAGAMWPLFRCLREAFVETHEHDMLGEYAKACCAVKAAVLVASEGLDPMEAAEKASDAMEPPIEMGNLDIRQVIDSDYFFS